MISDLEQPNEPHPNILRYEKLRMLMGLNLNASWSEIEDLAAVACYHGSDAFDQYLDDITPDRICEMLGVNALARK
jgi:hypothetical protein